MPETWTIGRLLQWTTGYLKDRHAESPRLDAEVLLAHALGCQRIQLYTRFEEEPVETVRDAYRALVKERAAGKPVAYLVGKREFYSLSFRVTPDVLIPRPETEFVVVRLLDLAAKRAEAGGSLSILDVGTGSGILAVCAAKYLPAARVTAVDISPAALDIARKNAAEHGVGQRIDFVESDLLTALPADATFDFIVSNPPYITTAEMEKLAVDVRKFEPRQALEAGQRGTEVIERLIPQAAERLLTGGTLLIEVSPMIEPRVRELIASEKRFDAQPTTKDMAGLPRVVEARRK
jgi:release factor glutamine methyltransferase